jgi:hypothetical protein
MWAGGVVVRVARNIAVCVHRLVDVAFLALQGPMVRFDSQKNKNKKTTQSPLTLSEKKLDCLSR